MSTDTDGQQGPSGWAGALAGSIVAHLPVPSYVAEALERAFAGSSVLRFVLAQGAQDDSDGLESFELLRDGVCAAAATPLVPQPLAHGEPTAVQRCLQQQRLVQVDGSMPDRHQLADWRQLAGGDGGWLLAAPLECREEAQHARLLGAVVVAGRGAEPSVDPQWLQEWGCEMACLLAHASASLEKLAVLFPPRVLGELLVNAAKKSGQVDLAGVLRSSASGSFTTSHGGGPSPATAPSSTRSSFEDRAAEHLAASEATRSCAQGSNGAVPHVSPFAAAAAAAAAAQAAGRGRPPSRGQPGPLSPQRPLSPGSHGSLSPDAAALMRQASRGGSVASAVLRQMSLQSDLSHMLDQEPSPVSPHTWEVAGFEDILEQDRHAAASRRPSMALERAHSRPTPALDQCIAAATASMEEAGAGGLPAAVHQAEAHAVEQATQAAVAAAEQLQQQPQQPQQQPQQPLFNKALQAAEDPVDTPWAGFEPAGCTTSSAPAAAGAAAAAGPAVGKAGIPAVRVPWRKKPLENPLGSGELQEPPLLSPRKPSQASSASFGSAFSAAASEGGPAGAPSCRVSSGGSSLPSLPSSGSAQPTVPPPPPAAASPAARQLWDLSFAAPLLEANYRRWVAPYLLHSDAVLGLLHAIVIYTAAAKVVLLGGAARSPLTLAAPLLLAASALPPWLWPGWWLAHRTPALVAVRLLATLLFAVQLAAFPATVDGPGWAGMATALLIDSGAAALCLLPLRFPLPLSAHWPTSLLCLWVATAGASLGHLHAAHALPLTAVILAQVLSFLLASLLAYQREARLRRRFLHTSRRAAACLGGRPKRQGLPPLSPLAGKA